MGETLDVILIRTDQVDIVLLKCRQHLLNALERNQGEYRLEDIELGLMAGFMNLWIAHNEQGGIVAAAVTELRAFANRKICYILLYSANRGIGLRLESALPGIEAWARTQGADAVAAYTRRGFSKTLRDRAYNEVYTVIQKELTDRRLH